MFSILALTNADVNNNELRLEFISKTVVGNPAVRNDIRITEGKLRLTNVSTKEVKYGPLITTKSQIRLLIFHPNCDEVVTVLDCSGTWADKPSGEDVLKPGESKEIDLTFPTWQQKPSPKNPLVPFDGWSIVAMFIVGDRTCVSPRVKFRIVEAKEKD